MYHVDLETQTDVRDGTCLNYRETYADNLIHG